MAPHIHQIATFLAARSRWFTWSVFHFLGSTRLRIRSGKCKDWTNPPRRWDFFQVIGMVGIYVDRWTKTTFAGIYHVWACVKSLHHTSESFGHWTILRSLLIQAVPCGLLRQKHLVFLVCSFTRCLISQTSSPGRWPFKHLSCEVVWGSTASPSLVGNPGNNHINVYLIFVSSLLVLGFHRL